MISTRTAANQYCSTASLLASTLAGSCPVTTNASFPCGILYVLSRPNIHVVRMRKQNNFIAVLETFLHGMQWDLIQVPALLAWSSTGPAVCHQNIIVPKLYV